MLLHKVVRALDSELRVRILVLLCERDMTSTDVLSELKEHRPMYRQSVNKALEMLKESGLVRKYYDDSRKALYYSLVKKMITINLKDGSIDC